MTSSKRRQWLIDIVAGGVIGEFVGAIVAWNIAIYLGVPGGYDAGVGDVFAHSPLVGVLWLAALITGPVFGVVVARHQRHKKELRDHHPVGTR
jgi:hypothetical protein